MVSKADRVGVDVWEAGTRLPEGIDGGTVIALSLDTLQRMLAGREGPGREDEPRREGAGSDASWRERIWTVPQETRLGVVEIAEALGRSRSWVYQRVQCPQLPLPARKFSGGLVFIVGEVREWIQAAEKGERSGKGLSVPGEAA